MFKWFHHLINPHCEQCRAEKEIAREIRMIEQECKSCDTLRTLLAAERENNRRLLDLIVEQNTPKVEMREPVRDLKPITPMRVPWRVRQQMLEAEDRVTAQRMKNLEEEVLEKKEPENATEPVLQGQG